MVTIMSKCSDGCIPSTKYDWDAYTRRCVKCGYYIQYCAHSNKATTTELEHWDKRVHCKDCGKILEAVPKSSLEGK